MEMNRGSRSFALADRNSLADYPADLAFRRTPLTAGGRFGAFDDAEELQQGVFHSPSADLVLAAEAWRLGHQVIAIRVTITVSKVFCSDRLDLVGGAF